MTDPLSDVLEMVQARTGISGRLVAGGTWARRFANLNAIKFCAAVSGSAWWCLEGDHEPRKFAAGDILVMNGSRSLILGSSRDGLSQAKATPIAQDEGGVYRLGRGETFSMLAGTVLVDERSRSLLLDGLPPALLVGAGAKEATSLRWLLDRLASEVESANLPGRTIVLAELAQLLFVSVLRAYLQAAPMNDGGWLKGLGDRRLAPALGRMHADPSRPWSLNELASESGMSRTSFAVRFRDVMGVPPLAYLTTWRMHVAERSLRTGSPVAEVAEAVGYNSESAFSHAFKRAMGVAPGQYRRSGTSQDSTMREPDTISNAFST